MKGFRDFIERGNLLQLAVAFIMGVTFATVITSLVDDIIMPVVGLAVGGVDFSQLFVVIGQGDPAGPYTTLAEAQAAGAVTINYGLFVNAVIVFIIVALVLYFLVRAYAKATKPAPVVVKSCMYCATEIPLVATRCPHCTSDLPAVSAGGTT